MSVEIRLIGREELLHLVPYSIQHIYRLEKRGLFPKRVPVGENRVAWVQSEILDWVRTQVGKRGEA